MIIGTTASLAFAAACLTAIATIPAAPAEAAPRTVVVKHPPIVNPGDVSASWSPQRNIIESKQYDRLLKTNAAFRQERKRIECGPINDPELRQSCLASFDEKTPYVGSSTAPRHYRTNAGR